MGSPDSLGRGDCITRGIAVKSTLAADGHRSWLRCRCRPDCFVSPAGRAVFCGAGFMDRPVLWRSTFFDGYRGYGLLVASFTSAIVAAGAIEQPDSVFDIAIARGSYIVLGILCESALAVLFLPGARTAARVRLPARLRALVDRVAAGVSPSPAAFDVETESHLLSDLVATNARVEFDVLEMGGGQGHAADHARAALANLLAAMAHARGGAAQTICTRDLTAARQHISAILAPPRRDRFRFASRSPRHAVEALHNGIRATFGILAAWLVWIVTAWPAGPTFVSFVALVYGLLATREVPALASAGFYHGAALCAGVAGVCVFLIIPSVTAPECLALLLLVPMVIGGLAARSPRLVNQAFAFNMFLPVLIGPSNTGRLDEAAFLNTALAFLAAVLFVRFTFVTILPFRADSHLRRTTAWVERRLRAITRTGSRIGEHQWLMTNADSMVRAMRTSQGIPHQEVLTYMDHHLQAMVRGLWLIEQREARTPPQTPDHTP